MQLKIMRNVNKGKRRMQNELTKRKEVYILWGQHEFNFFLQIHSLYYLTKIIFDEWVTLILNELKFFLEKPPIVCLSISYVHTYI